MGTDGNNPLTVQGTWADSDTAIGVTTDTVGTGKSNTDVLIELYGNDSGTIWSMIKSLRETAGGHNDWFIGTTAEQNKLIESGLCSASSLWSSVEYDDISAYCWGSGWGNPLKTDVCDAVALRAF